MNQQPSTPITAATTSSSNYNNFNAVWSDQTIIVVVIFCSIALCIVCILSYIYIKNAIIKAKGERAFSDWIKDGSGKINLEAAVSNDHYNNTMNSPMNRGRGSSTCLPGPVIGITIDQMNESAHDWSVTV